VQEAAPWAAPWKEPAIPADLDELFAALGRQADSLPLAPARAAVHRGRQRRHRGVLAAFAAVLVVAAGAGVAAGWHRDDRQTPPATPDGRIRGMAAFGEPIVFGSDRNVWRQTVTADNRIFSMLRLSGGENRVVALESRTGALLWADGPYGTGAGVVAVPDGPLLVLEETVKDPYGESFSSVHVLDPATGTNRLRIGWGPQDHVVLDGDMLVTAHRSGAMAGFSLSRAAADHD